MMDKVDDWSDEDDDKAKLYYLTCILQKVIDMDEDDIKYFDEHYAFTTNFNHHGYGVYDNKISFSSKGIIIWNTEEIKIKRAIDNLLKEGMTDKEEIINTVADTFKDNQQNYRNHLTKIVTKIMNAYDNSPRRIYSYPTQHLVIDCIQ